MNLYTEEPNGEADNTIPEVDDDMRKSSVDKQGIKSDTPVSDNKFSRLTSKK